MSRWTEDDICRLCQRGVEHHDDCPHEALTCYPHSECPHSSCHNVEAKYKRDPFLGVKWFARCSLCGEKGPDEQRKDEALAWEQMHHEAVTQR